MRTDNEIERDVKDELQWDPDLDATDIAVSVKQSVVTLAGFVKSWSDKYEAEAATKRVSGVRGIANDLEVRLPSVDERPDPDIARDAVSAIKGQLPLSADNIRVVVKNGWVTLEGNVEWYYQKSTAESAVRRLKGVRGVINSILIKPRVQPSEVKRKSKKRSSAAPRSTPIGLPWKPAAARSFSKAPCGLGPSGRRPGAKPGRRRVSPKLITASSSARRSDNSGEARRCVPPPSALGV